MRQLTNWWNFLKIFWCGINAKLGFAKPSVLVSFLLSPYWETCWDAADILDGFPDKTVVAPVFDVLQKESNPYVRKRLIWILETNKAWDELFACLDSPEFDVRSNAASVLVHCGETRFVEPLLKKMREHGDQNYIYHDNIYLRALEGIVDKSSVGLIFEYLSNATPTMKKDLLSLLGASKDEQVFSHLLAALKDPKDEIREGAVLGLMALGDLRAKKSLQALLSDPSENVQNLVRSALHVL